MHGRRKCSELHTTTWMRTFVQNFKKGKFQRGNTMIRYWKITKVSKNAVVDTSGSHAAENWSKG